MSHWSVIYTLSFLYHPSIPGLGPYLYITALAPSISQPSLGKNEKRSCRLVLFLFYFSEILQNPFSYLQHATNSSTSDRNNFILCFKAPWWRLTQKSLSFAPELILFYFKKFLFSRPTCPAARTSLVYDREAFLCKDFTSSLRIISEATFKIKGDL